MAESVAKSMNLSTNLTSSAAVPLPPPPPAIKTLEKQICIANNPESSKIKSVVEQCVKVAQDINCTNNYGCWILCNENVEAKLQGDTPRCGLVSLSMAAEMANSSKQTPSSSHVVYPNVIANDISGFESEMTTLLNLAKQKNFSSKGEMFSANNLGVLAKDLYGLDVRITDTSLEDIDRIVCHLCNRNPILIPYDASPNHSPCLVNGKRSHWALLTGFFCAVEDREYVKKYLQNIATEVTHEINGRDTSIFTLNKLATSKLTESIVSSTLYLLARQPKSSHVGVWSWKALQESNSNLLEYNCDKENTQCFVLPEGGLLEGPNINT